jgi:hypothetical protein
MDAGSIWISIGLLCVTVFGAIKFLYDLRKEALISREARLLYVLVIVWLLLLTAHGSALVAVREFDLSSIPTLMMWMLANLLFASQFLARYPAIRANIARSELLWCAIVMCGALLLTWPFALGVGAIPKTIPVNVTLWVSTFAVVALAVLTFVISWEASS